MARLPQVDCPRLSRRDAVVRVGSWVVFLGAVGGLPLLEACAPEVTDSGGVGGPTPTPEGSPTPVSSGTPGPSPTPSPNAACGCNTAPGAGWTSLGLAAAQVPTNAVAYNASSSLFVCHDSAGLYAMSSLCTHMQCDLGQGSYSQSNLAGGFTCVCHGAVFDADGGAVSGPVSTPLAHYALTTDASGNLYANLSQTVQTSCRC